MTSTDTNHMHPEPQRKPEHVGRVLCIISGPALTSAPKRAAVQTPMTLSKNWFVVRERWAVRV